MRLEDVKKAIRDKDTVIYHSVHSPVIHYTVNACILRLRNNQWYYQLELTEINSKRRSVLIVDMAEVEVKK